MQTQQGGLFAGISQYIQVDGLQQVCEGQVTEEGKPSEAEATYPAPPCPGSAALCRRTGPPGISPGRC